MVAQDGRHRRHHLGEPNHELDLATAATCDVTFEPSKRGGGGGGGSPRNLQLDETVVAGLGATVEVGGMGVAGRERDW